MAATREYIEYQIASGEWDDFYRNATDADRKARQFEEYLRAAPGASAAYVRRALEDAWVNRIWALALLLRPSPCAERENKNG